MTAIAFRDGVLACDRQVTWSKISTVAQKYKKIKVPGMGVCVACLSGYVYGEEVIFRQLERTTEGDGRQIGDLQVQARYGFLIDRNLKVYAIYGDGTIGTAEHPDNQFFAEGSAFEFLMGAMAAGMGAESAVNLACQYMDGCGHGVDVINVKEFLQYDNL